MSMNILGTYKSGGVYAVTGRDGSAKQMMSFTLVDALGNFFPCQMWPDDAQFVDLAPSIDRGELRRKQVQLSVVSYSVRLRKFRDGHEAPWANFIVSDVGLAPESSVLSMYFTGTIKAGGVYRGDGTKKPMLWFSAVDEIGTTFPCQVWGDDAQFDELAPAFEQGVRRQRVSFLVASYALRMRRFADGHEAPQINFTVSDVSFPAPVGA